MLDYIGDVIEMVTKWLSVTLATYLNAGSPTQDYINRQALLWRWNRRTLTMLVWCLISIWLTHWKGVHWECLWLIHDLRRDMSIMNCGDFASYTLEDIIPSILLVNCSLLSLNFARVMDMIQRIIGNGKPCSLTSREPSPMIHRCLKGCSWERMRSWSPESLTMSMTYTHASGREMGLARHQK